WGASFPLALAGAAAEGEDPARLSGETYAANTAGSILGALLFSLVLIPAMGTRASEQLLIGIAVAAAITALASSAWATREPKPVAPFRRRIGLAAALVGPIVVAWGLITTVSDVPWPVIA